MALAVICQMSSTFLTVRVPTASHRAYCYAVLHYHNSQNFHQSPTHQRAITVLQTHIAKQTNKQYTTNIIIIIIPILHVTALLNDPYCHVITSA